MICCIAAAVAAVSAGGAAWAATRRGGDTAPHPDAPAAGGESPADPAPGEPGSEHGRADL